MIEEFKQWKLIKNDSHICAWIKGNGQLGHDRSILPIILPLIPIGGTVVDVGCYVGDHTGPYCDRVGPEGTVFAFDPNPEAIECCQHNCPRAVCMNVALGSKFGRGKLIFPNDTNYGSISVDNLQSGEVEIIALDSLGLPHIHFAKFDCEGCECQALAGSRKTIEKSRPIMLVEVNDGCLKAHNRSGKELMLMIVDMGYTIRNVYGEQPMEGPQFDILCFPKTQS